MTGTTHASVRSRTMLGLLFILTLSACGAAGDALGPTAQSRGLTGSTVASSEARVYVVHGLNGIDIGASEALPVDISVNGACALTGFTFREIAGPLQLPAGAYDIQVRLADEGAPCTGALAINAAAVPLTGGSNVAIVAHLSSGGTPTASLFANDVSLAPGRSRLIARHAAAFGAVDVLVNGNAIFTNVTNGSQGATLARPGRQTIAITPAGSSVRAWEAAPVLRPFTTYAAYAVGTPANGTFEVLLQVLDR